MNSLPAELRWKIVESAVLQITVFDRDQIEAVLVRLCTGLSTRALKPCLDVAFQISFELVFGKGWSLQTLLGRETWSATFREAYGALLN